MNVIILGLVALRYRLEKTIYVYDQLDNIKLAYFVKKCNWIIHCPNRNRNNCLTLKHRETHGCVVSTVATDALVLKHQAISILSTD